VGDDALDLERLVEEELFRPAPTSARALAETIVERHGESVAAIVFYGSCLRRRSDEGVLDFYVLVDSYRSAYRSRGLAWLNALLPPNVFYLELDRPDATLRAKYAVISTSDFERAAGPHTLRPSIWARFCQPALAVHVRDAQARSLLVRSAARAITTALQRILPLLSETADARRFRPAEFWERTFRETYGYEMRPEAPEATAELYRADAHRFDRAVRSGLATLSEPGQLEWKEDAGYLEVEHCAATARRARRAWVLRRPLAKLVYLAGLAKTTFTFGDWLPYALWKLERHTGTRIVPSERQRRHPFIWGWPLLLRVLWRRDFR
jgi:hypothetical protein